MALLLLRAAVAGIAIAEAVASLKAAATALEVVWPALAALAGVLLLVGVATPFVSGFITGYAALLLVNLHAVNLRLLDSPLALAELAVMSAVLAILGPGAISIDARIFGLKEVDIRGAGGPPEA